MDRKGLKRHVTNCWPLESSQARSIELKQSKDLLCFLFLFEFLTALLGHCTHLLVWIVSASSSRVKDSTVVVWLSTTSSLKIALMAPLSFSVWNCSWGWPPECHCQLFRKCLPCRTAQGYKRYYVSWPAAWRQAKKITFGTARPFRLLLKSRDPLF